MPWLRRAREDIDRAAHRAIAEDAGRCAARHLDPLDVLGGKPRPIDPAAEWRVYRDTVPQQKRAARSGRSEAAQRDALSRGVGRQARGAAEHAEARDVAHAIVQV